MLIIDAAPSIPGESSDAHDAPIQHVETEEETRVEEKGKGKAAIEGINGVIAALKTCSDVGLVDWTKYEPPEGLRYPGDPESDTVIQIIQESIDRVNSRIIEEEQQKLATEEARRRQEEEGNQENEEADQTTSDNTLSEASSETNEPHQPVIPKQDISEAIGTGTGGFLTKVPKRPRKRTLMNLFRKLNSSPKHGESSAAGAARHRLLTSSSTVELTTHSARKRFVLEQIKRATGEDTTSAGSSTLGPEVECVSCLDDFNPKDTVRAPCHNYCTPCFRRLIASACQNEQRWPPKCCLNVISESTILAHVEAAQRAEYRSRAQEWNVPMAERIYCSQAWCSLFIRPEYVIRAQNLARCTNGHYTCITCRNARHEGDVCPQDRDMQRTEALAEEEGWKRCHGCGAYVEHREACQHMSCLCGAEFCYVCGARWLTCRCNMAQLTLLKEAAATRRQERMAREAAEEAEIQEAILLIAEFEREEALKAELLRQEQARVAEERRRAELAERIRRESERRRAVTLKFEELRATFDELHAKQRDKVVEHHERRERQLAQKSVEVLQRLLEMHETERGKQRAKVEAQIAQREDEFRAEYGARVVEERRIEAQYAAELRAFWGRRKGGEESMAVALRAFKRRMDEGFAVWQAWTDDEMEAYGAHIRGELVANEERMEEQERRLRSRVRDAALALVRLNTAELKWVSEVVEERARLLGELETDEIENGEDIDTWFAEGPLEEALAANPWQ
ncbi:hypothetical protein F4859DRAFT_200445 [Xylaria cf. heliscus]|nr:hypothetical protein F4859DRAFT_200445 [Xylaria cf. heliscus]